MSEVLSSLRLDHTETPHISACPQTGCRFRGTIEEIRRHIGAPPETAISDWQLWTEVEPHAPHRDQSKMTYLEAGLQNERDQAMIDRSSDPPA